MMTHRVMNFILLNAVISKLRSIVINFTEQTDDQKSI